MSVQDRRIGFFGIVFETYKTADIYFDRELFKNFIVFVLNLPSDEQIIDIPKYNKAISIDKFALNKFHADYVAKIVYKSCKYNHNPDYMSSIDGTERTSDKKRHEGEKEKTHLCIRISTHEAEVILEERKSGVSINEITRYLNKKLKEYFKSINKPRTCKIIYNIEPSKDFIAMVNGMRDIKIAELYTTKTLLGSETMNLMEREDNSMKDEIIITTKAKPKESMLKETFIKLYHSLTSTEKKVSRIRIYGHDEDQNFIRLDTSNLKKLDYVTVNLEANGTVNSDSMFEKMHEILEISGDQPSDHDW